MVLLTSLWLKGPDGFPVHGQGGPKTPRDGPL